MDQVLGTRDGIRAHNVTQVGVEEELLSDWDKNETPENNFDNETLSSNQQNMKNKSGNTASSPSYEYLYQRITVYEIFGFLSNKV